MILITPPEPAVTLEDAKENLRVTHDDDDDLITGYIASATASLDGPEGRLRKAIMPQTWELAFDAFPAAEIRVPFGPLMSVTSVSYYTEEGLQTVDDENYEVDPAGWIVPHEGYSWPAPMETINAVRVRFVAGMGDECPAEIRQAILLLVQQYYDGTDVTAAVDSLIHIRKRIVLA